METQQLEQWNTYMDVDTGEYLGEGIFLSREYVEKKQEAQVNKAEGFAKMKKKDEFSKFINCNFGSFYFNNYMKLLKKLFNHEYKELEKFKSIADEVIVLDEEYSKLSEDEKRLYRRKQTKDGNKLLENLKTISADIKINDEIVFQSGVPI